MNPMVLIMLDVLKIFLISLLFIITLLILYKLIIMLFRSIYELMRYVRLKNYKFQFKDFNNLSTIHFSMWCKNLLSKHGYIFTQNLKINDSYGCFKVMYQDAPYIVFTVQHMLSINDRYVSDEYVNLLLGIMEEYKIYNGILITNGKIDVDLSSLSSQFTLLIFDSNKLKSKFNFTKSCHLYFSNN